MRAKSQNTNKILKAWFPLGLLAIVEVAGFAFVAQPAIAQTAQDIWNRLERIDNEIQTLSRTVYRGEAPPPGAMPGSGNANAADTEVRLQQMETELRNLRGMIEEQSYEIRTLKGQFERFASDVELRLGNAQPAPAGSPSKPSVYRTAPASSTAQNTVPNTVIDPSPNYPANTLGQISPSASDAMRRVDTATAEYENAFALLKNQQYDPAAAAFQSFINKNPDHVLVGNAQYWLGETYYVRGQYENAARTFAESYKRFPRGTKAPDNLLKLGMSLSGMGNNDDACVAFKQLEKEFSSGAGPVLRRAEQEMSRLGC